MHPREYVTAGYSQTALVAHLPHVKRRTMPGNKRGAHGNLLFLPDQDYVSHDHLVAHLSRLF